MLEGYRYTWWVVLRSGQTLAITADRLDGARDAWDDGDVRAYYFLTDEDRKLPPGRTPSEPPDVLIARRDVVCVLSGVLSPTADPQVRLVSPADRLMDWDDDDDEPPQGHVE